MAFKMRVLYYSKKGKMAAMAQLIADKYGAKIDDIPPAYPCENEKLVVIGISSGKEVPNDLRLFLCGMDKTRAKNVAIFFDGPKEAANECANYMRDKGVNVYTDMLSVSGGLPLKFLKGVKDEEKKALTDWIEKIYADVEKQ